MSITPEENPIVLAAENGVGPAGKAKSTERIGLPRILEAQQSATNHEDREGLSESLYGPREIAPDTVGTYSSVLADEYMTVLDYLEEHQNDAAARDRLPDLQKKMFAVVDREFAKQNSAFNWKDASPQDRRRAFRSVFEGLLKDPQFGKEWAVMGMEVTKRHIIAIQVTSEAQFDVTNPADKIIPLVKRHAVSAHSGGKVEDVSKIERDLAKSKKKGSIWKRAASSVGRLITAPVRIPIQKVSHIWNNSEWAKREEMLAHKDLSRKQLFSEMDVWFEGDEEFDPDRQLFGGGQLDEFQKRYVEQYRSEFVSANGVVDPDSTIRDALLTLDAAQQDAYWALYRTQILDHSQHNLVGISTDRQDYWVKATLLDTEPIDSGIKGVDDIELSYAGAEDRLSQLLQRAQDRQQSEIEVEERKGIITSVDNQIKVLEERTQKKTLTDDEAEAKKGFDTQLIKQQEIRDEYEEYEGIDNEIKDVQDQHSRLQADLADVIKIRDTKLGAAEKEVRADQNEVNKLESKKKGLDRKKGQLEEERDTTISTIRSLLRNQSILQGNIHTTQAEITQIEQQNQQQGGLSQTDAIKYQESQAKIKQLRSQQQTENATITHYFVIFEPDPQNHTEARLAVRLVDIDDTLIPDVINDLSKNEEDIKVKTKDKEKHDKEREGLKSQLDAEESRLKTLKDLKKQEEELGKKKARLEAKYPDISDTAKRTDVLKAAKAEIERMEKEIREITGEPSIADIRQKEVLELAKTHILISDKWSKIQNRAMEPNFAAPAGGTESAAHDVMKRAIALRPNVPPAYLQAMRILGGDEAMGVGATDQTQFTTLSRIVTPDDFMRVYLQSDARCHALEAVMGTGALPVDTSFFDNRLQTTEVRQYMFGSITPDVICDVLDDLVDRAQKGELGRMTEFQERILTKLQTDTENIEDIQAEIKRVESGIDIHVNDDTELYAEGHERSRFAAMQSLEATCLTHKLDTTDIAACLKTASELQEKWPVGNRVAMDAMAFIDNAGTMTALGTMVIDALKKHGIADATVNSLDGDDLASIMNQSRTTYVRYGEPLTHSYDQYTQAIQNFTSVGIPIDSGNLYLAHAVIRRWSEGKTNNWDNITQNNIIDKKNLTFTQKWDELRSELEEIDLFIDDPDQLLTVARTLDQLDMPYYEGLPGAARTELERRQLSSGLGATRSEYMEVAIDRVRNITGLQRIEIPDLTSNAGNPTVEAQKFIDELKKILPPADVDAAIQNHAGDFVGIINTAVLVRDNVQHIGGASERAKEYGSSVATITRDYLALGEASSDRIYEGLLLATVATQVNKEYLGHLERAMREVKTRGTAYTLQNITSHIQNAQVRGIIEGAMSFTQDDMVLMYNHAHPPATPQDAITSIIQIPPDDIIAFATASLYNQYGVDGLHGSDARTLTKLIGSTLEEAEFKRQGELYDNVYWGVEGDDLIAAIHETFIHDADQDRVYKKAQTIAHQVEQIRKKRVAKRS